MKSVDILVSNYNSCEAIQLCVESVIYHTQYHPYQIIVYDDCSTNGIDLPYLRDRQDKKMLRLIEGRTKVLHGGVLNILINETCRADLAVILDCDTQILEDGWLEKLILLTEADDKAIGICNCYGIQMRNPVNWLAPFCEWWFGMLNMNLYRDGMMVDWQPIGYRQPEIIKEFVDACTENPFKDKHIELEAYSFDVGCKLYHKILTDNPKGYHLITPLSNNIKKMFRHYFQVSHHLDDARQSIRDHAGAKLTMIRQELKVVREGMQ